MPRRKKHLPAKQKRLIATRLMQISLLVDDYVYQHKSMSERSAEAYIKEIAAYKDKCFKDARSLQVIEKLTRCMTEIINEQQELHGADAPDINEPQHKINETNEFPGPSRAEENVILSPVYSEIDEDLTQIPQHFEVEIFEDYLGQTSRDIANYLDNDIAEIDLLGVKDINTDSTINVKDRAAAGISFGIESVSEVINLCDEDIDELIQNQNDFHETGLCIQNSISNLSIRDVDETCTLFSQQCSQSILDNNTQNNTFQPPALVPPINYDDVVKSAWILQKPKKEMVSFRHGPTKIVLPTSKPKLKIQANINKPVINYTEKIQQNEIVFTKTTAQTNPRETKCNLLTWDKDTQNSFNQPQVKMVPPKNNDDVVQITGILQNPATETITSWHGPTKVLLPTSKQEVINHVNINESVIKYTEKMQKKETVTKNTAPKSKNRAKRNYRKAVNASEINAGNGTKRNTKNSKAKATNKKMLDSKDLNIKENPLLKVYTNENKPNIQGYQKDTNMKKPTYQNILTTASTNTNIMSHDITENTFTPLQDKTKKTYVQNLSWVENLRFVRQIQMEELEPFTEEGFWENFDLPAKFNEDDFNY